MADWILIKCLGQLFAEFDRIAPDRDRASDGAIGDTAHQHEVSDHNPDETGSVPIHDPDKINEVHAIDVDSDLRTPGVDMERVVQFLLARCRSGAETRLRYIIYYQRIWSASDGWRERPYTGASQHREHAHFSASYDSAKEASTASWHLEEAMPVTPAEIKSIAAAVLDSEVTVGSETWTVRAAIGYAARESYLIDKALPAAVSIPTVDEIADAVAARLTPPPAGS
jgi:hypothetical protein